jgi:predicted Zn-dependent peptidase
MEDTSSRMSWLLKSHYYYDKVNTVEEVMAKIDQVTADDVQRLANEYFISEDVQLTAIGNFPSTKYFKVMKF